MLPRNTGQLLRFREAVLGAQHVGAFIAHHWRFGMGVAHRRLEDCGWVRVRPFGSGFAGRHGGDSRQPIHREGQLCRPDGVSASSTRWDGRNRALRGTLVPCWLPSRVCPSSASFRGGRVLPTRHSRWARRPTATRDCEPLDFARTDPVVARTPKSKKENLREYITAKISCNSCFAVCC